MEIIELIELPAEAYDQVTSELETVQFDAFDF